jgi:hypothetical protein
VVGRFQPLLGLIAGFVLLCGLPACAIDPVPTPGQDVRNSIDDHDAVLAIDTAAPGADSQTGGCTCVDEYGHEWNCDAGAGTDVCPCEPSAIVCPEGTPECEGAEVPEVVEP